MVLQVRMVMVSALALPLVGGCGDDASSDHGSSLAEAGGDGGDGDNRARQGADGGVGASEMSEGVRPDGGIQPSADAATDGQARDAAPAELRDGGSQPYADATTDGQTQDAPPVELPDGSRELDGVLNLVDPELAEELADFLDSSSTPSMHPYLERWLVKSTNRFLELYREEYDFILFLTHGQPPAGAAGRHQDINRTASVGTGMDMELAVADYRSDGRLRAVVGVVYFENYFGPYAHEIGHYWMNNLDPVFGFEGAHWGYSGVNGLLGGFDESSVRCRAPAAAALTDCMAESNGRVRYIASSFAPGAGGSRPFAPFELYLMGLVPPSEVPESFLILDEAEIVQDSYDPDTDTVEVEASGFHRLSFSDVIARHGEVPLLPEDQRAYRAAFVILSAEPVSDETLSEVGHFAAIFGGREEHPQLPSWNETTSGLSTMDTLLGERRTQGEPVPEPAPGISCDPYAQDCARDELGCYGFAVPVCSLAGSGATGDQCFARRDCEPGFDCFLVSESEGVCQPYCEPDECPTMCEHQLVSDTDGSVIGAICLP